MESREKMIDFLMDDWKINIIWFAFFLCVLSMVASPFVWIWHSGDLALNLVLTGFIGFWIFGGSIVFIKKTCAEAVDGLIKKQSENKGKPSKFQQKMAKMMKEAEERKNKAL